MCPPASESSELHKSGTGVIKIWGPRDNGAPRGPRLLTFWGPHCDFGAPFELVQWFSGEERRLHTNVRTCQKFQ